MSTETPGQDEIIDSDIANARRFARQYGDGIRFTIERGWLVWDGRRWAADEKDVRVQGLAKKAATSIVDEVRQASNSAAMARHARGSQSRRSVDAMVYLARSEPGIAVSLSDFDVDPWLLNVANGTIDLRTGELRPHRPEDRLTKLTPVRYDPASEFERWDAFLTRVCGGSDELYQYLRRLLGYLLTGSTSEQVLHFLYGLGANGKSVFCEIVKDLLGEYAVIASPEMIMVRRPSGISNDVARLRGARVALMNETSQGARFDEAKLKDLTGSDTLTARYLYGEFFDFSPSHKLIIRGNHKPTICGTDEGIWRRLRLILFSVLIPCEEQDKQLLEKLRAELPGILRWAVQGCLEWQDKGLAPPSIVLHAIQDYREESDTLGRFIDERCERRKQAQVASSAFASAYRRFCESTGERGLSQKELRPELERRGFEYNRTAYGRYFLGLELTQSPNWMDSNDT